MSARHATGVRRLDDLLQGGLPDRSHTLLYGPKFLGKEVLAREFFLEGLRRGEPGLMVTTDACCEDLRASMAAAEPRFPGFEQAGLVRFVDTYSRAIGLEGGPRHATFVDSAVDLNAVAAAVHEAAADLAREHRSHRLVFDSLSTLITYTNAAAVFRFLQVLGGRTRRAGATGLVLLDQGMHAEADVVTLKHLTDGVIEVRNGTGKSLLHLEGLGVTENIGWVEYRFGEAAFEITGSFAAGRIR